MRRPTGAAPADVTIRTLREAIRGLSRRGTGLCWCKTSAHLMFDDALPPTKEEQLAECTGGNYCEDVRSGLRKGGAPFRKLLLLRDSLLQLSFAGGGYCFCQSQEHTYECLAARSAIVMARPWVRLREAKEDEAIGVKLDPRTGVYKSIARRRKARR